MAEGKSRTFLTGATRDTDEGKFDYEGFLSPQVLRSYAAYMHFHRKQSDGTLRDSDNWQKGIPRKQYIKSLWRHFMDLWRVHRRYYNLDIQEPDLKQRYTNILCAIMFNTMGYLHEVLEGRDVE